MQTQTESYPESSISRSHRVRRTLSLLGQWLLPSLTLERRIWPLALGALYVLTIYSLGGLQFSHVLMGCLSILDLYNEKTRLYLKYFFPFMLTGIVFDSMRYYYWSGVEGHIHVREPYEYEKLLFGIRDGQRLVTPNEYFEFRIFKPLDLLCGFAYLVFVAEYLSAAFYLFFKNKFDQLKTFGWCFFTVNVMGFITYFIYPAAPPWYITKYGLGPARLDVHPDPAAAIRFDQILGTHFFTDMYGKGIDVFGSIPSLHVSYPLLVVWVAFTNRVFRAPALFFYFLMCFSAVYLQHHYVIDIVLGTLYAILALVFVKYVRKFLARNLISDLGYSNAKGTASTN